MFVNNFEYIEYLQLTRYFVKPIKKPYENLLVIVVNESKHLIYYKLVKVADKNLLFQPILYIFETSLETREE